MIFRHFYSLICEYRHGKISRSRFELEWELCQKVQGIEGINPV